MSFEETTSTDFAESEKPPEFTEEEVTEFRITRTKERTRNNPTVKRLKAVLQKARKEGPSEEGFFEMQDIVEEELLVDLPQRLGLNLEQIKDWVNQPPQSILRTDMHNFDYVLPLVTEFHTYAIQQYCNLKAYISYWKDYEQFLTTYGDLLSEQKSIKGREAETSLELTGFFLKKKEVETIADRVAALRDGYEQKSKTVSRLVARWELEAKINPNRSVMRT